RERARVRGGEVDVELLGVQRARESGGGEGPALVQVLLQVDGDRVHQRLEKVAAREVARAVLVQLARRQRARLLDVVLRALVRDGEGGPPAPQTDARDQPAHA